ncbi:proline-rich membrane anchor 1 [Lates japonicus]|uniref:Proline-rich membrane anchor 1 n=1 Tax=Lates japonicus TaxID=270547 RepID=A0AAD3R8Q4_LATJO|nr:proline-rich membrane anchor 1 [Lates japonicus]
MPEKGKRFVLDWTENDCSSKLDQPAGAFSGGGRGDAELRCRSRVLCASEGTVQKPLRKEENGTSRGEYAMSIRNKKAMGTNNTVV